MWVTGRERRTPARRRRRDAARSPRAGRSPGATTDTSGLARLTGYRLGRVRHRRRGRGRHQLPGLRERRARHRPRAARHQRLRSRPESVAVQRVAGLGQRPTAGRGRGVHRARDLPPRRAALRQGDRPHRAASARSRGPAPSRLAALGVRGDAPTPTARRPRCATRPWRSRAFGTADQRFVLPAAAPLGDYRVAAQAPARRALDRDRLAPATASPSIAPPEFLVDVAADIGRALLRRFDRRRGRGALPLRRPDGPRGGALDAPAAEQRLRRRSRSPAPMASTSARPAGGTRSEAEAEPAGAGRGERRRHARRRRAGCRSGSGSARRCAAGPSRATLEATVTDVNRQTVSAATSLTVHPGGVLPGARSRRARAISGPQGRRSRVGVIAVRPDGGRVPGRPGDRAPSCGGSGTQVQRERARLRRAGRRVGVGHRGALRAHDRRGAGAVRLHAAGGRHLHRDASAPTDAEGRAVSTSFYRWATGKDWVPWNDESQFKMDVDPRPDPLLGGRHGHGAVRLAVHRRRSVDHGRARRADPAAAAHASPSGTTTLKLPITEAFAPNAFVSIVVARGRSAPPGPLDDPGRPTIRVGYAELRVTPERKRLTVDVAPLARGVPAGRHRAGRARRCATAAGAGQRSEVTLWAVDEGVLALTGYRTPDPIDLLYRPRGLGHAAGEHAHDRGAAGGRRREGQARARRRRRRGTPPTSCAPGSRPPRSSSARWSPTRRARATARGQAARQPHDVPRDGGGGDRGRPLRQRPVVAAGHPAAGGAAGAAAIPARGRPVRRRRGGQQPQRRHAAASRSRRRRTGAELEGPKTAHRHARGRARARGALRFPRPRRPTAPRSGFDATERPRCRRRRARAAGQAGLPPAVLHRGGRAPRHGVGRARCCRPDIDPARSHAAAQPGYLAARDDPGRVAVAPGLSLLVLRAGGQRRGAAARAATAPAPSSADSAPVARRRAARARPRRRDAEPAAAERRRHRPLERRRLDHAVAHAPTPAACCSTRAPPALAVDDSVLARLGGYLKRVARRRPSRSFAPVARWYADRHRAR